MYEFLFGILGVFGLLLFFGVITKCEKRIGNFLILIVTFLILYGMVKENNFNIEAFGTFVSLIILSCLIRANNEEEKKRKNENPYFDDIL